MTGPTVPLESPRPNDKAYRDAVARMRVADLAVYDALEQCARAFWRGELAEALHQASELLDHAGSLYCALVDMQAALEGPRSTSVQN